MGQAAEWFVVARPDPRAGGGVSVAPHDAPVRHAGEASREGGRKRGLVQSRKV